MRVAERGLPDHDFDAIDPGIKEREKVGGVRVRPFGHLALERTWLSYDKSDVDIHCGALL